MQTKSLLFYLLILFFFSSCDQQEKKQSAVNDEGIAVASMADVGIDSSIVNKIDTAITNGTYPNIHSLLITRNSKLVYEKYWPGKDQSWGDNFDLINHGKDSLHDIRSISKSVVSACVGIAIKQGKIKSVDQKVLDFFPEYTKLDTGIKSLLTIKHLLTMTPGFVWNEGIPYSNLENSERRMDRSANQIEFVLSQPMEFAPGQVWNYNGGCTQLLAAIIEKTTGKKVEQFAKEYLFQPLNITNFKWEKNDGTDMVAAASGLRMRSRDLLKFGLMYDRKGVWQGKEIIDPKWVEESFKPNLQQPWGGSYGYQFWLWQDTIKNKIVPFVYCDGKGDQKIIFDKTNDLLIVATAGNYNTLDDKNSVYALLKEYVYPALINNK